jgi:hypothetical protein
MKRPLLILGVVAAAVLIAFAVKSLPNRSESIKNQAWAVLEEYLTAAQAHDLEALRVLSYQLSDTCLDPERREACNALMDNVYNLGQLFVKEDFMNILFDDKQVILYGEYNMNLAGDVPGITRPIIYFVREGDQVKLLSFHPFKGTLVFRGENSTSTIVTRLEDSVKDSDGDTMPDQVEECVKADEECIKTDPNKKDTDGDGFWDSIEALFYER